MTFYEKYPQLQDKAFLSEMLTENVFATMALKNQEVPKEKVREIVLSVLADNTLEKTQLKSDQIS